MKENKQKDAGQENEKEEELILFSKSPVVGATLVAIGRSSIRKLTFVGREVGAPNGVTANAVEFPVAGSYAAWLVSSPDYSVEVPEGYRRFMHCGGWLRIYDDTHAIDLEGADDTWFDLYRDGQGQILIVERKMPGEENE